MKKITYQNAVTATTSITGATGYDLGDIRNISVHCNFSGSDLAGTLKMQQSNDGSDWVDMAGTDKTATITSAASVFFQVTDCDAQYIRTHWTQSGGSGTLTTILVAKKANPTII